MAAALGAIIPEQIKGGAQMFRSKLAVATIPVSDLERSKRFYGEKLGLALVNESPFAVRYDSGGGSQISIFKRPPTMTEHTLAHFEVADIEAAVRDLGAKGVVFEEYGEGPLRTTNSIAQLGPARGAWFRDPDGHILGLRQG